MLKHYIEYSFPGSFMSNHKVEELQARIAPDVLPENCFAYQFFDRTEVTEDGETLTGPRKNTSPMYYLGETLTLEDVKALPGDTQILQSNMRCNGWDTVVRTVCGNFQPLREGDVVIAA